MVSEISSYPGEESPPIALNCSFSPCQADKVFYYDEGKDLLSEPTERLQTLLANSLDYYCSFAESSLFFKIHLLRYAHNIRHWGKNWMSQMMCITSHQFRFLSVQKVSCLPLSLPHISILENHRSDPHHYGLTFVCLKHSDKCNYTAHALMSGFFHST